MHPYILGQLAVERARELRAEAKAFQKARRLHT